MHSHSGQCPLQAPSLRSCALSKRTALSCVRARTCRGFRVATGMDGTWTLLDHRYARINTDAVGFIVNIILHVRIYARFASDRAGRRSYEAHTRRTARSHRDPSRSFSILDICPLPQINEPNARRRGPCLEFL